MRPYLKLIIDSQLCDLPENGFSFDINKRVNEGLDPAGGNVTRSISLPSTKINDAIFDRWFDAVENNQSGTQFKTSTLISNGLVLVDGLAQVTESEATFNPYRTIGKEYKVTLKDGNSDWITRLGDLRLADLDWSGDVHALTDAEVLAGYVATYGAKNWGYFIAKTHDWVTIPPIYANAGSKAVVPILSTAFIFIRSIVDKIFSYLGLNYTSAVLNTDLGTGLIMPILFPEKYGADFSEAYLNVKAVRTGTRSYDNTIANPDNLDMTAQTQTPPTGANPLVLSTTSIITGLLTATYTAKSKGFYKFNLTVAIENPVSGTGSIPIVLVVKTNTAPYQVAAAFYALDPFAPTQTITFSQVLPMGFGQVAEVTINFTLPFPAMSFDITSATLEVIGDAEIAKDTPIDFKFLLFDWKCKDFLKGIGQVLNLQFDTQIGSGNVDIDSLDNGFLTGVQSWQSKADASKSCTDTTTRSFNEIIFGYKKDSDDKTVAALENNSKLGLFDGQFTLPSTNSEIGINRRENAFFAPTASFFDSTIKPDNSLITPLLPIFWSEDFNLQMTFQGVVNTYVPRILFFAGQRGGIDGYVRLFNGTSSTTIELPAAFMVNYNDLTAADPVLSYDNTFGVGLLQKYFINSMSRLKNSRIRNCYFYLNDLDISQLSFRKKIEYDGCWWVLKEIKGYNPMSYETTQVELELDNATTDADFASIINSNVKGFLGYKQ